MNFTEFYYTEAKLSAWQQIKNIFSRGEKIINIDLNKDLDVLKETDQQHFDAVNNLLSEEYASFGKLKRDIKVAKIEHQPELKSFKLSPGNKEVAKLKAQAGGRKGTIINSFKVNIKGGIPNGIPTNLGISPEIIKNAIPVAYETGRHLIHYGYIVLIILECEVRTKPDEKGETTTEKIFKYLVGADKKGLEWFREKTGKTLEMFVSTATIPDPKRQAELKRAERKREEREIKEPEEEKEEIQYVIIETDRYTEMFNEIKNTWGYVDRNTGKIVKGSEFGDIIDKISYSSVGNAKIGTIKNVKLIGYEYTLRNALSARVCVYFVSDKIKALIIMFVGKEQNKAVRITKDNEMFKLKSIPNPKDLIYNNIDVTDSKNKL